MGRANARDRYRHDQTLVDRGENARPAAVAAVWHFLVADAELGRDDDVLSSAAERPRQCLLGDTHAVGFCGVEAGNAIVDRLRDGALELALVNLAVGAADLPTPESDRRDFQVGAPKPSVFHMPAPVILRPCRPALAPAQNAVPSPGARVPLRCPTPQHRPNARSRRWRCYAAALRDGPSRSVLRSPLRSAGSQFPRPPPGGTTR